MKWSLPLPSTKLKTGLIRRSIMENIALIGIDLGKNSFHIHCQDSHGKALFRKKFTRSRV